MSLGRTERRSSATANSIRILETVARFGPGTTAKDIVDTLSMPAATAFRLLNALVGDEYLVRSANLRGFALGNTLSALISASSAPTLSTAAQNCLQEFRDQNTICRTPRVVSGLIHKDHKRRS